MRSLLILTWVVTATFCTTPTLATIYVINPEGTGDFSTIQEAVDSVDAYDVIELLNGIYTGDGNRDVDFLGKDITIRSQSGIPDSCVIDCEGSSSDPHRGFLFASGEGPESVLEGVSIQNGECDFMETGGGIVCLTSSPTIAHCAFFWCTAPQGCAISCDDSSCPTISDCTFTENGGGGAGGAINILPSSCATVVDCTFLNNSANSGGAIDCEGAGADIIRCTFLGNIGILGSGVTCREQSDVTVEDCMFRGNGDLGLPGLAGGAITCLQSTVEVTGTTMAGNAAMGGGGILLNGSSATITGCTIVANQADVVGAAMSMEDASATVENTIFWGNCVGEVLFRGEASSISFQCCDIDPSGLSGPGSVSWLEGNIVEDPLFCFPRSCLEAPTTEGDYGIALESPCSEAPGCGRIGSLPAGCVFEPTTYLVNPDGSGDFATIQEAIDAAAPTDIIDLGDGVFTGDGNRDLDCLGKDITIQSQGGDPGLCVIDCEGSAGEYHRGFNLTSGEGPRCRLMGVTITGAYAEEGGAIYCANGSSPWIESCVFTTNGAEFGAGVFSFDSNPLLLECAFSFNQASTAGGAVFSGGPLGGSAPRFLHCTFTDNEAPSGGAAACIAVAPLEFESCAFGENGADLGGALYCAGASMTLRQCTLYGNFVTDEAGGMYLDSDRGSILENTIIAFSGGGEAIACLGSPPLLSCCDLYGNEGGDWVGCIASQQGTSGNIEADPLFCDAPNGDLGIDSDSPCAWANNPGCGYIGAYPVSCGNTTSIENVAAGEIELDCTPSPFASRTKIRFMMPPELGTSPVHLRIYDPAGRLVRILVDGNLSPGTHEIRWDGTDGNGRPLADGVYFPQLLIGGREKTDRLILLR